MEGRSEEDGGDGGGSGEEVNVLTSNCLKIFFKCLKQP